MITKQYNISVIHATPFNEKSLRIPGKLLRQQKGDLINGNHANEKALPAPL